MRKLIDELESAFERLHQNTIQLLNSNSYRDLFDSHAGSLKESPGVFLIRSAAIVEQCFGGITSRLWDDPFEWTLPERFSDSQQVLEYLSEVKKTREVGFRFLVSDSDLSKSIPAPGGMRTIFSVLIHALLESEGLFVKASVVRTAKHAKHGLPGSGSN